MIFDYIVLFLCQFNLSIGELDDILKKIKELKKKN